MAGLTLIRPGLTGLGRLDILAGGHQQDAKPGYDKKRNHKPKDSFLQNLIGHSASPDIVLNSLLGGQTASKQADFSNIKRVI
jgi:hypothetical protein